MKDFLYVNNVERGIVDEIIPPNSKVTSDYGYILVQTFHSSKFMENISDYAFSNIVSSSGIVSKYQEAKDRVSKDCDIYGSWINVSKDTVKVRTDHLGTQKVYHYIDESRTIITTCMKLMLSILRMLCVEYTLSKEQAILFLYARETKWPKTIINEVNCFFPSCNITIENGNFESEHYAIRSNIKEKPHTTLKILLSSLRGYRASSTLSGGVDSQCITNLCKPSGIESAISCAYFSEKVNNDYNCFNEIPYARKFSEDLSLNLIEKRFTLEDVIEARERLLQDIDQPSHDPTSFYLMCRTLHDHGFDAIVSGMGGDAIFSSGKELNRARFTYTTYYGFFKYIPKKVLYSICKVMSFRGPFNFLYQLISTDRKMKFFELIDLTRPYHYTKVVEKAISRTAINNAKEEYYSSNREHIFKHYEEDLRFFGVNVEWKLNAAVLLNPDEFNVEFASKKNNIRAIMPLAMPSFVSSCLKYKNLNREKEMDLLELSNRSCLISSKSGFTVPYEEWIIPLFIDSMNSFLGDTALSRYLEIDTNYIEKLIKCNSVNRSEAAFIQRIDTLYKYVKNNNVSIAYY